MHTASTRRTERADGRTFTIRPAGGLPFPSLADLWQHRDLLHFLTWRDIKVRYKQTAIGVLWVLIQPEGMTIVFTVFFGMLAGLPSDDLPYPVFAMAGLLQWQLFSRALTETSQSLVGNERPITRVYFPGLLIRPSVALPSFQVGSAVTMRRREADALTVEGSEDHLRVRVVGLPLAAAQLLEFSPDPRVGLGLPVADERQRATGVKHRLTGLRSEAYEHEPPVGESCVAVRGQPHVSAIGSAARHRVPHAHEYRLVDPERGCIDGDRSHDSPHRLSPVSAQSFLRERRPLAESEMSQSRE